MNVVTRVLNLVRPIGRTASAGADTSRGYAICTLPRSGSNYLCEVLGSTGVLGRPKEYFNAEGRRRYDDPAYPDDPHEQIERILTMGATPNGVYALKLFPTLFDSVVPHFALTKVLPDLRFVRLRRRDILDHAISYVKATQTQAYRSTDEAVSATSYDPATIQSSIGQICQWSARWDMFFARTGLQPVEITYEDLLGDPQAAADRVAKLMDVRPPLKIDFYKIPLRIQRDQESADWRERFRRECGDPNYIDSAGLLA
ncbi:MAG: hypothetical protein JOZ16_03595 [Methylobacteriaceae bacterium]|nr:hypothetical protein [Methylobacteriaceae bacterium]